jgi:hypothetical protein
MVEIELSDRYPAIAWAERNRALGITAAIASAMFSGRVPDGGFDIGTSFPPAFGFDERFWGEGPYRLQDYRAVGDGSYVQSTTIVGGRGLLGMTLLGATAIGSAMGNKRRRDAAARDMQPRWVEIDSGHLTVGSHGLYLQSATGMSPWSWQSVASAEMVAPGKLYFTGHLANGSISWIVESAWSELAFLAWAAMRHQRHRQVLDGSWFPGGWCPPSPVQHRPSAAEPAGRRGRYRSAPQSSGRR